MDFEKLAQYAAESKASDIHLACNYPPMLRIHGDIQRINLANLTQEMMANIANSIMTDVQRAKFAEEWELDFSITVGTSRYRVNAYRTIAGTSMAFRLIPGQVIPLSELNLPAVIERFAHLEQGLVLVTGPTGSGKSTTLASLVNHINQIYSKHIVTIEDPVEFVFKSEKSLINQREVGGSTRSFNAALKSALREDPDVLMIGEMRDLETIKLALTAAETGHLVFGTLHTSSAAKTVTRIVDVFPPGEKDMVRQGLAQALQGVVAQRLLQRPEGQGRIAVHEVLVSNSAIRNLITENKIPQIISAMQVGGSQGMILMEDAVSQMLNKGLVTKESAESLLMKMEDNIQPSGPKIAEDAPRPIQKNGVLPAQVYTRSDFE
jgi:twitching motility protein PilT